MTLPEIWDDVASEWDMACPSCGKGDEIEIAATIWVRLVKDGTDADLASVHDHEWDSKSPCKCTNCGWEGTVAEAEKFYADNTTE